MTHIWLYINKSPDHHNSTDYSKSKSIYMYIYAKIKLHAGPLQLNNSSINLSASHAYFLIVLWPSARMRSEDLGLSVCRLMQNSPLGAWIWYYVFSGQRRSNDLKGFSWNRSVAEVLHFLQCIAIHIRPFSFPMVNWACAKFCMHKYIRTWCAYQLTAEGVHFSAFYLWRQQWLKKIIVPTCMYSWRL